jgi:hypothetical protein
MLDRCISQMGQVQVDSNGLATFTGIAHYGRQIGSNRSNLSSWNIFFQLERFERLEDTALLESALWKLKIHELKSLHGHPPRSTYCEDPTEHRVLPGWCNDQSRILRGRQHKGWASLSHKSMTCREKEAMLEKHSKDWTTLQLTMSL